MTASDLRIGNYVLVNNKQVIVDSINDRGINMEYSSGHEGLVDIDYIGVFQKKQNWEKEIFPVPLTQDLMLKFGAEYQHGSGVCILMLEGIYGYGSWIEYFDGVAKICLINGEIGDQISDVHTLQNTYFALTGNELSYEK